MILVCSLILHFGCGESVDETSDVTADDQTQPMGSIKGNIQPSGIEAKLELIKNGQVVRSSATDKSGQFVFADLEFGTYQIRVISDGYQTEEKMVPAELQQTELVMELKLKPLPAQLSGIVINSEGEFISGATVTLGDQTQVTNDLGVFRFDKLEADIELEITVVAESMLPRTVEIEPIAKGESSKIQVELESEVIEEDGAEVGDTAPTFSLLDTSNQKVSLADYAGKKNILLTFNRGKLWPVCAPQLVQLLKPNYNRITDLDTEVIAISPWPVAENKAFKQEHKLPFPYLADLGAEVIRQYDVLDFQPLPKVSFFLIDKAGKIHWRSTHSGGDPNDLPQIDELLAGLKKIQ